MKVRQLLSIAILVSALALPHQIAANSQNTRPQPQATGQVHGTVMDFNNAVIPHAKLVFIGGGLRREIEANEAGDYWLELPVGEYQVTAHPLWFCEFQRAPFRVRSKTDTLINLLLSVCALVHYAQLDKHGRYVGEGAYEQVPFKSETLSFKVAGTWRSLPVQFSQRQQHGDTIEYQGQPPTAPIRWDVMVSYDVLTIHAEKVRFNLKTHVLEADFVRLEDGQRRTGCKHAAVDFNSDEPKVILCE